MGDFEGPIVPIVVRPNVRTPKNLIDCGFTDSAFEKLMQLTSDIWKFAGEENIKHTKIFIDESPAVGWIDFLNNKVEKLFTPCDNGSGVIVLIIPLIGLGMLIATIFGLLLDGLTLHFIFADDKQAQFEEEMISQHPELSPEGRKMAILDKFQAGVEKIQAADDSFAAGLADANVHLLVCSGASQIRKSENYQEHNPNHFPWDSFCYYGVGVYKDGYTPPPDQNTIDVENRGFTPGPDNV